jgi:hypothetical protein
LLRFLGMFSDLKFLYTVQYNVYITTRLKPLLLKGGGTVALLFVQFKGINALERFRLVVFVY